MSDDHFLNLQPGTIVNGRYEIVKCLGTGSMGMVYACRHRELAGHMVAMKVLFSEVARDEIAAARFRNEIVAAYGVSHPNVVRAYEYFRDGDLIAFTMEYIGGGDLADRLNGDTPLEIEEIVDLLHQMCSGVQAIHDAGIIHRDLKPENILITSQGKIKITDFGIARTGTGPKLTEHGGVVGTIDYVSPEYLERGQVDGRSDIYALGVLAYEMLTGDAPFKGKSVIETMTMRLRMDPRPPHEIRPDCPEEVSRIILKALRRDPEERYQKGAEMQQDLFAFLRGDTRPAEAAKEQAAADEATPAVDKPKRREPAKDSIAATLGVSKMKDPLPSAAMKQGDDYGSSRGAGRASSSPSTSSLNFPRQSTLTRMEKHINGELEKAVEEANDAYYHVERMESVLGKRDRPTSFAPPPNDSSPQRNISVSQAHLNVHRMSQLSHGMRSAPKSSGGGMSSLVTYFVIVCLGFGVGFLFLNKFFPEFLAQSTFLQQFSGSKPELFDGNLGDDPNDAPIGFESFE